MTRATVYTIHKLPACTDWQGTEYPDRYGVTLTLTGNPMRVDGGEYMSRGEAIAAGDKAVGRQGRHYRGYSNILWGSRYCPESRARHCIAADAVEAKNILCGGVGLQNLQIKTANGWRWATETPVHLGGIFHGELA